MSDLINYVEHRTRTGSSSRIVRVRWLVNAVNETKPKELLKVMGIFGGAGRARTDDPRIMSPML